MTTKNAEQFHRYGWIAKGRKYWSLGLGNPFMIQWFHVPISRPKDAVIKAAIKDLDKAKVTGFRRSEWTYWQRTMALTAPMSSGNGSARTSGA